MIRVDGRKNDELRPIVAMVGVIPNATGSAFFKIGNTAVYCAVHGPRELHPRHEQDPEKAKLRCYYDLLPFSVKERKRPGPDRRSIELSWVIEQALAPAIYLEEYPRCAIDIYMDVISADAGTRCASIVAASMALADAGISMRDLVSAVAVGKVCDEIIVDPCSEEEQMEGATDMPLAVLGKDQIVLLQMDGRLSLDEFKLALELGLKACAQIYEIQKNALKRRYES